MADDPLEIAGKVHRALSDRGLSLCVAETCTAGRVGVLLAGSKGAGAPLHTSIVCHSQDSLKKVLGVSPSVFKEHGPVSEELAREMALGAVKVSGAHVSLALACDLDPEPAETRKPGLVYIAVSHGKGTSSRGFLFEGSRDEITDSASAAALHFLYEAVSVWT
jgi:PncC family amidohydrolase